MSKKGSSFCKEIAGIITLESLLAPKNCILSAEASTAAYGLLITPHFYYLVKLQRQLVNAFFMVGSRESKMDHKECVLSLI